jgi:septum site-determining protein MinD
LAKIIVVTSGKGGVGKTTTSAAISSGLALRGHKTVVIDFDIGLRNLDLVMNCERRVVYDFVNVINGESTLKQALIKDKRCDKLFILPASQTRDKDALTKEGVEKVMEELAAMGFEFIICDSPAGIEHGAFMAMYFADAAIIVANPEVSSVRDSDRILGLLQSKTRRAERGEQVDEFLLITRYSPERVEKGEMPESQSVLKASNQGVPVIYDEVSLAGQAYSDAISRLLGEQVKHRFLTAENRGFIKRLFRRSA